MVVKTAGALGGMKAVTPNCTSNCCIFCLHLVGGMLVAIKNVLDEASLGTVLENVCEESALEVDGLKPCRPKFAFILPSYLIDRMPFW